jgi:hypothetical protein
MLVAARTTRRSEKRNKHERGKKTPQSPDLPAHGHYYMPAVGPVKRHVHHLRATCDAREPVCLHENTPGELAPPKLIRPGALSRSARDGSTFLGTAPSCGLPWCTSEAVSQGDQPSKSPQPGQKDFMFDCTATACHPNLKPGSTIVALLCGDARTMS